ncbi:hypothetical protein SteCoe_16668 [Stentor coeruleus]|uniref:Uncharacterized protein n=1 Tax=Stentor coeruleus TaxID=5963 RepID=A0A1R2C0S6_9CILI|nr:hypothetical protein SteCoe_16668 [Stentor coeruleus]
MFKNHFEDPNDFSIIKISRSHKSNCINNSIKNTDSDLPKNHLSGTIICLTLRKILKSHWNTRMKFSFGLIRGLYLDGKRLLKPSRSSSRNTPTTPKNTQILLISTPKTVNRSTSYTKFNSESTHKTLKRVEKKRFHYKIHQKTQTAVKFVRKIKSIHQNSLRKHLYFILDCINKIKYMRICQTFKKAKLKRISEYYVKWYYLTKDNEAVSNFWTEYNDEMMILPLPLDIHDYIDDFFEVSKKNVNASYFSFNSTQDITSRITTTDT